MQSIFKIALALGAFLGVILLPDREALAWGPGVHIAIGDYFLSNLGLLPAGIAEILRQYNSTFLYGSLSADIFVGKGSTVHPTHSHNWNVGKKLLLSANTPRLKAYALGYMSHLTADTVAHNYFVPNFLSTMPVAGKISHVYSEVLADSFVNWDQRKARRLLRQDHAEADITLLKAMDCKALPFVLKKRLVHNSLRLTETRGLGHSIALAKAHFAPIGTRNYFDEMFSLSISLVGDFLKHPDTCPALGLDPVGTRALWSVKQIIRKKKLRKISLGRRKMGTLYPISAALRPYAHAKHHAELTIPQQAALLKTGTDSA